MFDFKIKETKQRSVANDLKEVGRNWQTQKKQQIYQALRNLNRILRVRGRKQKIIIWIV